MTDGPRSAIIIASLALLRLHVSVDRIGDGCIGAACLVLVDDRGACCSGTPPEPRRHVGIPAVTALFLSADALLDYDVSEALDGRPTMPQPSGAI